MVDNSRQADEPTPQMIEAGATLLLETEAWYEVGERARDLAKRVYRAMLAARPESSRRMTESSDANP